MNHDEFVEAIVEEYRTTIRSVISVVANPPGRRPRERLIALSEWYKGLPEPGKEQAANLVTLAVHDAVFGMLAILDGSHPIGADHIEVLVDGQNVNPEEELHDTFQALLGQELF